MDLRLPRNKLRRRSLFIAALTPLIFNTYGINHRLFSQDGVSPEEQDRIDGLLARFKAAALPEPTITRSSRFVAVGSARADFVKQVLRMADDTALSYSRYLGTARLPVKFSATRMTIVVLANAGQYSKLLGQMKARNEGGHFDLDENWTVTFDHRGRSRSTRSSLERSNQVTLIHEVTHQLSFNTGLLNINGDVPMLVSEGLATLAEPAGQTISPGFGKVNSPRIAVLNQIMKRNKKAWIPLGELLKSDDLFDAPDDATLQMAYSQSWLFWDTILNRPEFAAKLPVYLKRIEGRVNPDRRLDDFNAQFGPLAVIEEAMKENLDSLNSNAPNR